MSQTQPAPVLDYKEVAGNQLQQNIGAQQSSNISQFNPYGSLTFQQTGTSAQGTPIYAASQNLSPEQQQILNLLQGSQTTAGRQSNALLSGANYGMTSPTQTIGDLTTGLTSQTMEQAIKGMTPYYGQQTSQLDTQLRNQGFKPGDPAYNQAMNALQQNQNQSVSSFEAQFQPQAFSEATNLYQMPANLALTMSNFAQPGSITQNLAPTAGLQPANVQGAAATEQQALEQNYAQKVAQSSGMMQGLFGLGGNILGGIARGGGFNPLLAGAGTGISNLLTNLGPAAMAIA